MLPFLERSTERLPRATRTSGRGTNSLCAVWWDPTALMILLIILFQAKFLADGHTASNTPDLF